MSDSVKCVVCSVCGHKDAKLCGKETTAVSSFACFSAVSVTKLQAMSHSFWLCWDSSAAAIETVFSKMKE